ncbi:BREX-3 system P-loop-containing protein BrxF [Natronospora cellulosivora (SeqCode)]
MVNINELIENNKANHNKLIVLVGDKQGKKEEIINYLQDQDWEVYDIEEAVLNIIENEDIPQEKIHLRIGEKIKNWINTLGDKLILINSNILFSPEVKKITPTDLFAYAMRGQKQGILFLEARLRENEAIYSTPDRDDYCKMDLSGLVYENIENVTVRSE